jgi:hypothetical protein
MMLTGSQVPHLAAIGLALCCGVTKASFAQTAFQPAPEKRNEAKSNALSQYKPQAFPLAHFVGDFASRDQPNTLCLVCTKDDGGRISVSDYDISTEKRPLGFIANHAILEIHTSFAAKSGWAIHSVTGDPLPPASELPEIVWKTIVIGDDRKLYRQLYSVQGSGDYVQPLSWSAIYKLDGEDVLATNDPMTGNGGSCTDGYWRLYASDPHPIDFSQVDRAMAKATPKGSALTQTRCWALDIASETIASSAQKPDSCHACGYTARITAHFHLQGNMAIPDKIKADPIDDSN